MKWNIMALELRLGRKSFLIGASVILPFQLLLAAFAETVLADPELVKMKYGALPPAVLEGFGIVLDQLSTYEGFMAGQAQTYYVLLLAIYAAIWASSTIARERERETKEFLFSLPYSRTQILFSRALVHWMQITVIYVLTTVLTIAAGYGFSGVERPWALILLCTAGYLIALALAGIGYVISALVATDRASLSLSIGLVMFFFVLNMLGGLGEPFASLSYLSLMKYFNASDIVRDEALTWSGVLITLGIYGVGLATARSLIRSRDL